jgi:hypothetical protein
MTLAELQVKVDEMETSVAANETVDGSAEILLDQLSALLIANQNDPAAIAAIAESITNKKGRLDMSNDRLTTAVTRNTPAA